MDDATCIYVLYIETEFVPPTNFLHHMCLSLMHVLNYYARTWSKWAPGPFNFDKIRRRVYEYGARIQEHLMYICTSNKKSNEREPRPNCDNEILRYARQIIQQMGRPIHPTFCRVLLQRPKTGPGHLTFGPSRFRKDSIDWTCT